MIVEAGKTSSILREVGKICDGRGTHSQTDALIINGKIIATNGLVDLSLNISDWQLSSPDEFLQPFLFPAARLARVTHLLPSNAFLKWTIKGKKITVRCDETKTQVSWLSKDADTYPITEKGKSIYCGNADAARLRALILFTESAQARKSQRMSMTGQFWEISSGELKVTTTDGSRLSHGWIALDETGKHGSCIVPGSSISVISERLKDSQGPVSIHIESGQIVISQDTWEIASRLVDDTFIDYRKSIPDNQQAPFFKSNRINLLVAMKIGDIATGSESVSIEAHGRDGYAHIFTASRETGQNSEAMVDLHGEIEMRHPVTMNLKFTEDALNSFTSETVSVKIGKNDLMMLLDDDNGWFYLLAPLRTT